MKSLIEVWEEEKSISLTPAQVKQLQLTEGVIEHSRVAKSLEQKGLVQQTDQGAILTDVGRKVAGAIKDYPIEEVEVLIFGESINVCSKKVTLVHREIAESLHEVLANRSMSEVCKVLLSVYGMDAQRVIDYLE